MYASVIIPLYNAEKTIGEVLEALDKQTLKDFEVVIVNDGSTDNSLGEIDLFKLKNNGRLLLNMYSRPNSGPSKTRNYGALKAKSDVIIFLDSDCVPKENWLHEMIHPLQKGFTGCSCSYRVKNKENLIARYIDYEINKRQERLVGKEVNMLASYSLSFLKKDFLSLGGFPVDYKRADHEDSEFAFRAAKSGCRMTFTDKTIVYHYHPTTLMSYLKQQFNRGYWRMHLFMKNLDVMKKGEDYSGRETQIQFILATFFYTSLLLFFFTAVPVFVIVPIILLSNIPLGVWCWKREKKFFFLAPLISSLRSLSGSLGVYLYMAKFVMRFER